MATFLFKTEPSEYSFDDLVREKRCVWDGVSNAAARLALRACAAGDEVLVYHTGDEKRIVGVAKVAGAPRRDPHSDDDKSVVVDLVPVGAARSPVTLARIKADPRFKDFALVKQPRLSVMAVPGPLAAALKSMLGA